MSLITNLWHLFILSMMAGVITAATTLVPAQTVITLWFHKKRGRAMGITLMGIGIGGLVAPLSFAWFIQQVGWRGTNRIAALVTLIDRSPAGAPVPQRTSRPTSGRFPTAGRRPR